MKKIENLGMLGLAEATAGRVAALAERFERARKRSYNR